MSITAKEYAEEHGCSVSTARNRLNKMVREGLATSRVCHEASTTKWYKLPPVKIVRYTVKG
jgi:hypothetical protein